MAKFMISGRVYFEAPFNQIIEAPNATDARILAKEYLSNAHSGDYETTVEEISILSTERVVDVSDSILGFLKEAEQKV